MSKKGGAAFQKDAPWRTSQEKPIPKIHHSPVLRVPENPFSDYAVSVMRDPNPVGHGLAVGAVLEGAGPECIVPGQATPIKLLGLKKLMGVFLHLYKEEAQRLNQLDHNDQKSIGSHSNGKHTFELKEYYLKVWPIDVDLKFLEPVGRELVRIGKPMRLAELWPQAGWSEMLES
ncbi:hypothetical protein Cgig2_000806 [Carnegiea gigantea]|uniref:Uncharacterized protein n=1 Tax=Carnegiea gigantea TaxID=171969 RepID=A0A9Q1JKN6_9CARY|nr:hypothetical protein Cgig2_000806 [Carnegiea gigantea]